MLPSAAAEALAACTTCPISPTDPAPPFAITGIETASVIFFSISRLVWGYQQDNLFFPKAEQYSRMGRLEFLSYNWV